ncbi:hypothetical protein Golax_016550 [Gossypium laxum]|uniref:Uncharacterized protein n=1 Tax=Gossypium laxum TaxID=34288 RepID=A0A7J8YY40_9ROSI|nr:hypothetical protein [Gossypium laxum]
MVVDLVEVSIEVAIANATSIGSIISKLLENKSLESFESNCFEKLLLALLFCKALFTRSWGGF